MLAARPVPSIVVQGNVAGSIVAGDHNFVVNTNYGTIISRQAAPRVKLRDLAPASPRTLRDFVGRERELAALDQYITQYAAVVVSGLDGLGKTTLVKQVANGAAARALPNGVVYLEAIDEQGTALGLGDVIQRLFDALFESDPPLKVNSASARTYLSNTRPLVVLDRLQLLPSFVNLLADLFPQGALLTTSVDALAFSDLDSVELGPLARGESVQLFAARSGLTLDDTSRAAVESLCVWLADVPLAIATVANVIRVKHVPLAGALQFVAAFKPVATGDLQAGMERAFALTFAHLSDDERRMLSAVAVLPGTSIDRPWLEMTRGGQAASASLEELDLLQPNSPRLRAPPGLRAMAARGAKEQETREALFAHLRQSLATRSLDFDFVADELGNLLGLLEWLVAQQRWGDVIALGQAVDPYLTLRGLWDTWRAVLDHILEAARATGDARVQAWALHQLGTREVWAGEAIVALAFLQQALALRRSIGDLVGAAYTQHNIDVLYPPPPPLSEPPTSPPRGPRWKPIAAGVFGLALIIILGLSLAPPLLGSTSWSGLLQPAPSLTSTPAHTATLSPSPLVTHTPTQTATGTFTPTPSTTPTSSPTVTQTRTRTNTPTSTRTRTGTSTNTPTSTPTLTPALVPVKPPPPAACIMGVFGAKPTSIPPKGSSTLFWDQWNNADYIEIDHGVGSFKPSGFTDVSPTSSTKYTLTAHCGSSNAQQAVTVNVVPNGILPFVPVVPTVPTIK